MQFCFFHYLLFLSELRFYQQQQFNIFFLSFHCHLFYVSRVLPVSYLEVARGLGWVSLIELPIESHLYIIIPKIKVL